MGTMFARMFLWEITTPRGSAVAPEVKMISAVSVGAIATGGASPAPCQSMSASLQVGVRSGAGPPSSAVAASTPSPTRTSFAPTMPRTFLTNSAGIR